MKKISLWALALLTALSAQAQTFEPELADPKPGAQETWNSVKKASLAWGSTDIRYSRSQPATGQKTLLLDAWRGERVSAQAVLSTPVDLARVTFEVSDLRNGKAVIPASRINKYFVRYVMTDWHENKSDSFLLPDHLSPETEMKVEARHLNAAGVCQGGAYFTLADLAFAAVTNSHGNIREHSQSTAMDRHSPCLSLCRFVRVCYLSPLSGLSTSTFGRTPMLWHVISTFPCGARPTLTICVPS